MDIEYCSKCGLLHDPNDGDCLGCKLTKEMHVYIKRLNVAMEWLEHIGYIKSNGVWTCEDNGRYCAKCEIYKIT